MIQTSEAYQNLVKSNVRPKCEPIIRIYNDDNTVAYEWRGKNIKNLKFVRSIDPISRELPYMELTWTEIYKGKLNQNGFVDKYTNASALMEVELSFEQTLGFFNTWQDIANKCGTWEDVKNSGKTWEQLFRDLSVETIKMPKMYLEARPTIKNSTITWVAKDILYFLNQQQTKEFYSYINPNSGQDFLLYNNILKWVLADARGNYINSKKFFYALQNSIDSIAENTNTYKSHVYEPLYLNNSVKNNLLNLMNLKLNFLNFENEHLTVNSVFAINNNKVSFQIKGLGDTSKEPYTYNRKIIYGYPELTQISNISKYEFNTYRREVGSLSSEDAEYGNYMVTSANRSVRIADIGNGITTNNANAQINTWLYKDVGNGAVKITSAEWQISDTNMLVSNHHSNDVVFVYPMEYPQSTEIVTNNVASGEEYKEDNPINGCSVYKNKFFVDLKNEALNLYFNNSLSTLEFNSLPNLSLEPGDCCFVETNLFDDNGERIAKKCLIVKTEISYNGALKVKNYAHEIGGI